jgi:hypothetical protein
LNRQQAGQTYEHDEDAREQSRSANHTCVLAH